jgi:hypothetical protein
MLYKLTHELLYILVDLFSSDAAYKIQRPENKLVIHNAIIRHYYAKMYYINNKTYNFRDLWQFLHTIPLDIKCIQIGNTIYTVKQGYVDLLPIKNITDTLLTYVHKTGSQDGDEHTIHTIINNFHIQNNL